MQRLHIDGRRGRRHAPRSENSGSSPLQLRLPCRNLIGVDVEMLRQLSYRPVALDGGKRHLRLEGRCVVPARSSVHGLSCSRRLSPLSGRNSTYRPVQICESGSRTGRTELKCLKCDEVDPMKTDAAKWADSALAPPTRAA